MAFHDEVGENCPRLAGALQMTEWGGVTIRVPTFWWQETNVSVEWPKSREAANILLSNDVCRYRLNFARFSGKEPGGKRVQLRDLNELNGAINEIVVEHLRAQDPSARGLKDGEYGMVTVRDGKILFKPDPVGLTGTGFAFERPGPARTISGTVFVVAKGLIIHFPDTDLGVTVSHAAREITLSHEVLISDGRVTTVINISKEVIRDGAWVPVF
jgi:hypothetical protein